jgi:hypothetical protein
LPYELSFADAFFWGDGSVPLDEVPRSARPRSVYQANVSLSEKHWSALDADVFNVEPDQLDPETVLAKVFETNTCRNLDSPVEVFVDDDGFHTLLVYDT